MVYQLKSTGAKAVLAHPSAAQNIVAAADTVGLPKSHLFLFSESKCEESHGLRDWTSMLGTVQEGQTWRWRRLTCEETKSKMATLNYSSGYAFSDA